MIFWAYFMSVCFPFYENVLIQEYICFAIIKMAIYLFLKQNPKFTHVEKIDHLIKWVN